MVLWSTIAAVGINIVVNWALIFGHWGFPELGVRGAATASVVSQSLTFLVLAIYAGLLPDLRQYHLFQRFWRADISALRQVWQLGWPIGLTGLAESGLFSASTMMMGWIGTIQLAAHGIAMEACALAFMVHLGLSNAATIRVGRAEGAGDAANLRAAARAAIALSTSFGLIVVSAFLLVPRAILSAFLDTALPNSDAIVALGVLLLALGALFQLADAMQAIALGLLRGIRDTRVPMVLAAVGYWGIGMPTAYMLAFPLGFGAAGVWLGLVVGLMLVATALMVRFWSKAPRPD